MRYNSYAKVNLFLKVVGTRDTYHEIFSRFSIVKELYDVISFIPKEDKNTPLVLGNFSCTQEQNSIYKACMLFQKHCACKKVDDFLATHTILVEKNIPEFAGLGGGSSNAAVVLNALDQITGMRKKRSDIAYLGAQIGADVPFFVYGYEHANVSGIGENITPFEDELLSVKLLPNTQIKASTPDVYSSFREHYLHTLENNKTLASQMEFMPYSKLINNYSNFELNDLLQASLKLYPQLKNLADQGYLFSGSGSAFFKVLDE